MKRIILLLIGLSLSTGLFAQKVDFGVKAGLNLTNLTNELNFDMKPSFYAGILMEINFNRLLSLQPELVYSRQGTKNKVDYDKEWMKLDYLHIPLLIKVYPIEGIKLSLELGPQFGFLIYSKYKYGRSGHYRKEDIMGVNVFDCSMAFGLAYKLPLNMETNFRYNLGLTKIAEKSDVRNSVIQLGLAYRF